MKHKPSDEEMRMMLTPRRVRVAAGNMTYVKYEASGKSKKRNPVLCLHGFPDNPDTFMHLGRKLAKMGHDVYVPYLRGYEIGTAKVGISFDCKRGVCDDIVTLINSLKLKEDIHLIGHDWGAFIVSVLAQKIPEAFASVTMMAVPHNFVPGAASLPRQLLKSWFVCLTFFLRLFSRVHTNTFHTQVHVLLSNSISTRAMVTKLGRFRETRPFMVSHLDATCNVSSKREINI